MRHIIDIWSSLQQWPQNSVSQHVWARSRVDPDRVLPEIIADSSESSPHPDSLLPLAPVSLLHGLPILHLLSATIQSHGECCLFYSLGLLLIVVDYELVLPLEDTPPFPVASAFTTLLLVDRYL